MNYCFIIPCYNNWATISEVVTKCTSLNLPTFIVNDGSNELTFTTLEEIKSSNSLVSLIHLEKNLGKGGAIKAGFKEAVKANYTHAIQIDADNQHNFEDCKKFISNSKANPESLILGCPIYDSSAPLARVWGRKITNFWVIIETLSFAIKDSLIGFRIYPIKKTQKIFNTGKIGNRMEFDLQIAVHLFWENTPIINIPTTIDYPEGGISHFDGIHSNIAISKAHTFLFFGMLKRLPQLLWRKLL